MAWHVLQAEVTYEWLRGTKDDGGYKSPSRLLMNKRKLRSVIVRPRFCNGWPVQLPADWPACQQHENVLANTAS